jgi:PAS domain S-box-containing protein
MKSDEHTDTLRSRASVARIGPWDDALRLMQLAAIVESSDDAIVSKTLDGRILSWNDGATRIFGYTPEEMVGQSITVIIPPELREEEQAILRNLKAGNRIDHFDTVRLAKDGRRVPISLTVSPIRDSAGNIVGASKIARDISDRKQAELLLREREDAMRDADRRKDEFLAVLAHELRNPLAPIRYALAIARLPGRSKVQERQAQLIIERQVGHMSRLLDDLLDVSRITRGTLALRKTRTELMAVLAVAIEAAQPIIDAKNHELTVEPPESELPLFADGVRLAQVFSNLLINAAKYTAPGGRIGVRARREHDEIIVSVLDSGIGMSPQLIPRLFKLFSQGRRGNRDGDDGLGVGLALARTIVEMHGGRILAHSQGSDLGSEFLVHLPSAEVVRDGPDSSLTADGLSGRAAVKVLLVDDNRDATDSCAAFLELAGHDVHTTYTGREALQLATDLQPDVVLLDLGLPDISGLEVAQTVRNEHPWGRNAVLIAVTGWGHPEDRRRAFAAGFDHYLTKPVAAQVIESLVRSVGVPSKRNNQRASGT